MPDLTPVAELRAAAATLRACAAAVEPDVAILHDVPWETESCDAGCQCIVSQGVFTETYRTPGAVRRALTWLGRRWPW